MAQDPALTPVMLEGAQIAFRNFTGRPSEFNQEGSRSFTIFLPEEMAVDLSEKGWNVRQLKPRPEDAEEGMEPRPILDVAVSWKFKPPTVALITSRGRTNIGEDQVAMLDEADIAMVENEAGDLVPGVDLIMNPSRWEVGGRGGIKAYLKSGFFTIVENPLELKYAQLPAQ